MPGKKELLLQAARDSLGNTCTLRLDPIVSTTIDKIRKNDIILMLLGTMG